jgi:hypothetical protein
MRPTDRANAALALTQMESHRTLAYTEISGDLFVRDPGCSQSQHLTLPFG